MYRNILILFFALISANAFGEKTMRPQTFAYPDAQSGFNEERLSRIDSAYAKLVKTRLMPHVVTLVIHKGEVVHYKAFGWRDAENRIPCERPGSVLLREHGRSPISVRRLLSSEPLGLNTLQSIPPLRISMPDIFLSTYQ